VAGSGAGVLGLAFSSAGTGVQGSNTSGTAVEGTSGSTASDATAINGVITSTSPGGFSSAVRGQNNGTGGLGIGVWGSHQGSGWGMYATSVSGIGIVASGGTGTGVSASGETGVAASGSTTGVSADGATGVVASGSTVGVSATGPTAIEATASDATGTAVVANAAGSGPAVAVTNTGSGVALRVNGRVHFSRSGRAVVAGSTGSPQKTVTVTGVKLQSTTTVLATLQTLAGAVGVAAVVTNPAASSFTIHLTAPVSVAATVGWFVIE
jgi:hypothetical protein